MTAMVLTRVSMKIVVTRSKSKIRGKELVCSKTLLKFKGLLVLDILFFCGACGYRDI